MTTETKEINSQNILSLAELAAKEVQKINPKMFLRFFDKPLLPAIQTKYVQPQIDLLTQEAEKQYVSMDNKRKEMVNKKKDSLSKDRCFSKTLMCLSGTFFTGIYLIIGTPLLEATEATATTTATYYGLFFLPFVGGSCLGVCLIDKIARGIASAITPGVPAPVIDLAAESQHPMRLS
ncbi:Uncharacterised protein [Legionella lansingensis]|uniref:Uncharacterized protein n=1 Tax=Legionella lansingensis TaxID=45067 RepID=A0A0W0VF91_9GAMM|nr:hypothetical protein [Legionella lansingensis]KTD18812.1 hypothetical protein Llan_2415 [Legionella lansingensis]SNV43293.1 Uncharacterised protein [Legionella lansingensis]